jgi:hypothetical protein
MRSPLFTLLSLPGAIAPGPQPPLMLVDRVDRTPAAVDQRATLPEAPVVVAVREEPKAPPPPSVLPTRMHTIWCPSCAGRSHGSSVEWCDGCNDCGGRGGCVLRPCVTCDGSGKLTVAVAPPFVAKMTRQLQRAAHRANARVVYSSAHQLAHHGPYGTLPRSERRLFAHLNAIYRSKINPLTEAEVLRAL